MPESPTGSDRFFGATVLGGRLHVDGVPEWGPMELQPYRSLSGEPNCHSSGSRRPDDPYPRRTRNNNPRAYGGHPNKEHLGSREPGG